jgi:hypothetical protein
MLLFSPDVISTVGPQGEYPGVLEAAYKNSLTLMMDNKLRSVVRTNLLNAPVFRIRIQLGRWSVSGFGIRILIQIQEGKNDPQK